MFSERLRNKGVQPGAALYKEMKRDATRSAYLVGCSKVAAFFWLPRSESHLPVSWSSSSSSLFQWERKSDVVALATWLVVLLVQRVRVLLPHFSYVLCLS
jgi:hypothetical protein